MKSPETPYFNILSSVVRLSLIVSHKKKAYLGIEKGYQIRLPYSTQGCFLRIASQVSLQEKILFFAGIHKGKSFSHQTTNFGHLPCSQTCQEANANPSRVEVYLQRTDTDRESQELILLEILSNKTSQSREESCLEIKGTPKYHTGRQPSFIFRLSITIYFCLAETPAQNTDAAKFSILFLRGN